MKPNNKKFYVVDLFCGAGGLTHGFVLEKFDVVAGIDADPACKYPYEENNKAKFICKDIATMSSSEVAELFPDDGIKILVGCAPCQPFSTYASRIQRSEPWRLLEKFAEIIADVQPDIISMENVPRLEHFDGGEAYNRFASRVEPDYTLSSHQVFCPDYGIPQRRKRLVVLGSKFGKIELIPPTHTPMKYRSVRNAIGELPPIGHGEDHPDDPLHVAASLKPINYRRIQSSKPAGSWRDWDKELIAECHNKKTGKSYSSVYGRMSWDEVSPTMTTQFYGFGNGRFGHPEQDRAISLREGAILQTFPRDYKFVRNSKEVQITRLGRLIGNAVPVDLGRVIAISILRHLECYDAAI